MIDPSLEPNIKSIRGIKSHHCFQFDVNYVDCCVMCGDAWDVSHVRFTSGPQTRSSSLPAFDQDDDNDDDKAHETLNKCTHMDDVAQLELDVNDDNEDDDGDEQREQASSPSSSIAVRVSKRQRVGKSTFASIKGNDYFDIDDIDLG